MENSLKKKERKEKTEKKEEKEKTLESIIHRIRV